MKVCIESILVSPADIEACWEKNDACFVKMKSGKVWVCMKYLYFGKGILELYHINEKTIDKTLDFIESSKKEKLIKLPLQVKRGESNE